MASVGQKNTGVEMALRSTLHRKGLRYRLHVQSLSGCPDLVFPRFGAVVFVHGCFWHAHGCYRATVPETRRKFWIEKFEANRRRDQRNVATLLSLGWRVLIVWECAIRGKCAEPAAAVGDRVSAWLQASERIGEIPELPRPSLKLGAR